jgi:hypothetical protein
VRKKSTKNFIHDQFELQLKLSLQVPARAWTRDILGSPRCTENHARATDAKKKKIEYARLI